MPTNPTPDRQAEMSAISAMLSSRSAIAVARDTLLPEDFEERANGMVYEAILTVADREPDKEIDFVLLHEELKARGWLKASGGDDYIIRLAEYAPDPDNLKAYANVILDRVAERRLSEIGKDIAGKARDPGTDLRSKVETAQNALASIIVRRGGDSVRTMTSVAQEYLTEIDGVVRDGLPSRGLETGFRSIDNITGGLSPTDLVVLASRPAMGKTSLGMNIALNVARRDRAPCLFFSLEMQALPLVRRTVATLSGIPSGLIRNSVPDGATYERLRDAVEQLFSIPILFEDASDQTIDSIRSKARRLHRETGGLSLIVVDYLQLITSPSARRENRTQEVGEVARGLKNLAKELRVPVMALAQLSREVEKRQNKRPTLSDLRESGSIEAEADIVAFIYRDAYYSPKASPQDLDPNRVEETEIIFAKHRNGSTGTVVLGFQPAYTRFREFERAREMPVLEPPPTTADIFGD